MIFIACVPLALKERTMIKANIEIVENGFLIHIYGEKPSEGQKTFIAKEYEELTEVLKEEMEK